MFTLIPYIYFLAREDFILSCFLAFHHSARSFLLLSQFRPRDVLLANFVFLLLMHTYARGLKCIRTNTCSEIRKQNIHASLKSLLPNKGFDAHYLVLPLQYISLHNRHFKVGTHLATSCSNTLQRQIASCVLENFCENLYLRNIILSLQQITKNQIRQNLCYFRLQNSRFFSQNQ